MYMECYFCEVGNKFCTFCKWSLVLKVLLLLLLLLLLILLLLHFKIIFNSKLLDGCLLVIPNLNKRSKQLTPTIYELLLLYLLWPLCRAFTITYLKKTMFRGYILLQLFGIYNLCYMLIIIIIIIIIYYRLLVIRWQSSGNLRSQQEIKATYPSNLIIIIIIIIIFVITFMQGMYNYMSETKHVCRI